MKKISIDERERMIFESFNKNVMNLEGADAFKIPSELNEMDFSDIKAKIMEKIPTIKGSAEDIFNAIGEGLSKYLGIAKEELQKPENKEKVKSVMTKLKGVLDKAMSVGKDILSDPKKLEGFISSLNLGMWGSLITGIAQAIFGSSLGITAVFTGSATIGGIFFLKLALVLFIIKTLLSFYSGALNVKESLNNMGSFIKSIIGIFTSKSTETVNESTDINSLSASINSLVLVYGY
tara:strand:- start:7273 stop:7977 length:705 start_codon:yes stop_codon:yes gene_type:complete